MIKNPISINATRTALATWAFAATYSNRATRPKPDSFTRLPKGTDKRAHNAGRGALAVCVAIGVRSIINAPHPSLTVILRKNRSGEGGQGFWYSPNSLRYGVGFLYSRTAEKG